ncbi:MAG: hypothetical protein ACFCUO_05085 [Rhodospirillales bacterium]
MALVLAQISPAAATVAPRPDPDTVRWTRLVFEAKHRLGGARTEIRLAAVSEPPGNAAPLAGEHRAMLLTATIALFSTLPLVGDSVWETEVRFRPHDGSALQRIRTKFGTGADRKIFQYLADGVRHVRLEPADRPGGDVRARSWVPVRETFFPYGPAAYGCPFISDPALLLFLASAVPLSPDDPPLVVCAFNKKTLHRAELRATGTHSVSVDRVPAMTGNGAGAASLDAVSVLVSSRPAAAAPADEAPFEFFEMRGDVEIVLDTATRLPIQARGTLRHAGAVVFDLVEADTAR